MAPEQTQEAHFSFTQAIQHNISHISKQSKHVRPGITETKETDYEHAPTQERLLWGHTHTHTHTHTHQHHQHQQKQQQQQKHTGEGRASSVPPFSLVVSPERTNWIFSCKSSRTRKASGLGSKYFFAICSKPLSASAPRRGPAPKPATALTPPTIASIFPAERTPLAPSLPEAA